MRVFGRCCIAVGNTALWVVILGSCLGWLHEPLFWFGVVVLCVISLGAVLAETEEETP